MTLQEFIDKLNTVKNSSVLPVSGNTPIVFRQYETDPALPIERITRHQNFDCEVIEIVLS